MRTWTGQDDFVLETRPIDIPTLLGCSAAIFAIIILIFLFFWLGDGRRKASLWFGLPFLMALCSACLFARMSVLPNLWGLRLGTFFVLLAYPFAWQAIRTLYGRPVRPLAIFGLPLAWLVLSATVFEKAEAMALSLAMRILICAFYNGLSAYELWRNREEGLSSRRVLFWAFVAYAAIGLGRMPFIALLPVPLGVALVQAWAVAAYNLFILVQALLTAALIISLSRERVSLSNYRLALLDSMTGVFNRRAFDLRATDFADKTQRPGTAILLFDLDLFKQINDRFGHNVGDAVIMTAARTAQDVLRKTDQVFRIGGEEFACLLPDTTEREAFVIAERLRNAFARTAERVAGCATYATVSIGVAVAAESLSLPALLLEADRALYEAKSTGRNRTCVSICEKARRRSSPGGPSIAGAIEPSAPPELRSSA
jgi:diguanylate cyclase (GGDEF)-like protein